MRRYDVVVVGGGHNGLVCAAYCAGAGLSTLVLERRAVVGGAAVTEEPWPGYRVSTLSYVLSLMPGRILRELELARHGLDLLPIDPSYFSPFPDGRGLLVWEDPRRAAAEVARFRRGDAEAYLEYVRDLDDMAALIRPLLLRVPPSVELRSWTDLREAIGLGGYLLRRRKRLARLAELMTLSVADFLDQYFADEAVKGALAPGGVIGAWGGPMSPGSAYVLLHHRMGDAAGAHGAWAFVRGGMGALSEAIAGAARARGADVRTGAEVSGIRTGAGRTEGVELTDGSVIPARAVVSAMHPRTTLLELVGARHLPGDVVREVGRLRSRGGSAKVNLALGELPDFLAVPGTEPGPQHPEFIISPSIPYLERAWDDAKYGRPSAHPMLDCVIPTTKDPSLAPEGRHVLTAFVQYAPHRLADGRSWDEEREALGDRVVDTIDEYAPNVKRAILHRQVVTPEDLEREYGLVGGNIFHGEMSLDQLFSLRPTPSLSGYRTPIRGLYLGGSGAHPGGGVTGAPGRNAARVVVRDLRRLRRIRR